jgi:molybdopterin converting factor subunit 1
MTITVLLFAALKDRAGSNRVSLELASENATLIDVRAALVLRWPVLAELLPSAVASVNQEFAFGSEPVHAGDEVAFFPPVSGGSDPAMDEPAWPEIARVAAEPLDLNELTRSVTGPATGAVCLFSGAVRGETALPGHLPQTVSLEYEAYEPMAYQKMRQVIREIRERWPLVQGIAVVQRVGRLSVGEPTVLIACASGHRDQGCFEAARYGIDRLKEIVPVWKKEIGAQGEHWIEGAYQPRPEDRARQ